MTSQAAAARWEALGREYEAGALSIAELAEKYGVNKRRIFVLRAQFGWKPRRMVAVKLERADVIKTMMLVLQRQVSQLENDTKVPGEKEAAVLASLVRSLEKLIRLDKVETAAMGAHLTRMDQDRLKLIRRLAELGRT